MNLKPYSAYKDSGVPWLGKVPEHWKSFPGMAILKEKQIKNVGLKVNTVLSLSYGKIIIKSQDKLHGLVPESFETYQIVEPGDIIIRSTDLQNDKTSLRVGKVENKGIITSAYMCLKSKNGLSNDFAHIFLFALDVMKVFYGLGSGLRQNLSWADFKRMPFFLPSEKDQLYIVRFLDYVDHRIKKYIRAKQKLIKLLEEQKQAIINDAVTGKIDVRTGKPYPKYKDSGIEWLGMVPEHWEIFPLKRLVKSNIETLSEKTDAEYEFDYLEINNVKAGYLLDDPIKIKFSESPSRARRKVQKGDTIISTVRTYLKSVLYIDFENCNNLIVSTGFSVLSPTNKIIPKFLGYLLQSDNFINRVILNSIGVSYPAIADSKLVSLKVMQPHLNEQIYIVEYITKKTEFINLTIFNMKNEISLIHEYRTRMIADVVTGKLDVREAAEKLPEEIEESDELRAIHESPLQTIDEELEIDNGQAEEDDVPEAE